MQTHVVELTRDVANPHPDRRSKDWNKLATIPAGTRFIVKHLNADGYSIIERNDRGVPWEATHQDLGRLILAASEPREPVTWREMAAIAGCGDYAEYILETLAKLKRLTLADFEAIRRDEDENPNN